MPQVEHKGYIGEASTKEKDDPYHGRVINIRDVISFYGKDAAEPQINSQKSIEDYLNFCKDLGEAPEEGAAVEAT